MNTFTQFAFTAGGALAVATVIAAWTFRSADAPTWAKIALPVAMMALVIAAPWKVGSLLGTPRHAVCEDLPKSFDLLAFSANDRAGSAYLWIKTGAEPVAYDVAISKGMAAALLDARISIAREGVAHVNISCKASGGKRQPPPQGSNSSEQGEAVLSVDKGEPVKDPNE